MSHGTRPTFVHHLAEDSVFLRVGFGSKLAALLVLSLLGFFNLSTIVNFGVLCGLVCLLAILRFYPSGVVPVLVVAVGVLVYSSTWLLFSSVPGDTVFVEYPWGNSVTSGTVRVLAYQLSRLGVVFLSGVVFLAVTTERELIEWTDSKWIPDVLGLILGIAFNTVTFTRERVHQIHRTLQYRGLSGDDIGVRFRRLFYVSVAVIVSNLGRVEDLDHTHTLRSQSSGDSADSAFGFRIERLGRDAPLLEDVELRFEPGETVGVYGPTGCGKSTLLLALGGLLGESSTATLSGSVSKDNAAIEWEEMQEFTAIAFQEPESQFLYRTVDLELQSYISTPTERDRLDELLSKFDMRGLLTRSVDDLSTGQRKLVTVVAALSQDGPLILLDEPSANLDEDNFSKVEAYLRGREDDRIIVYTTHDESKVGRDICTSHFDWDDDSPNVSQASVDAETDGHSLETDDVAGSGPIGERRSLLTARNLSYAYPDGTEAVSGVDLSVRSGEILGVVGPNGSGKTTLVELLTGRVSGYSGQIVRDVDIERIGLLYQEPNIQLFTNSVESELEFGLDTDHLDPEREAALLTDFGLASDSDTHPLFLSRGQKQLLLVACFVLQDCSVLLLDELFTGIDPVFRRRIREALFDYMADGSRSIVLTGHTRAELDDICTRIVEL